MFTKPRYMAAAFAACLVSVVPIAASADVCNNSIFGSIQNPANMAQSVISSVFNIQATFNGVTPNSQTVGTCTAPTVLTSTAVDTGGTMITTAPSCLAGTSQTAKIAGGPDFMNSLASYQKALQKADNDLMRYQQIEMKVCSLQQLAGQGYSTWATSGAQQVATDINGVWSHGTNDYTQAQQAVTDANTAEAADEALLAEIQQQTPTGETSSVEQSTEIQSLMADEAQQRLKMEQAQQILNAQGLYYSFGVMNGSMDLNTDASDFGLGT